MFASAWSKAKNHHAVLKFAMPVGIWEKHKKSFCPARYIVWSEQHSAGSSNAGDPLWLQQAAGAKVDSGDQCHKRDQAMCKP